MKLTKDQKERIADCRVRTIKALGALAVVALFVRLFMG